MCVTSLVNINTLNQPCQTLPRLELLCRGNDEQRLVSMCVHGPMYCRTLHRSLKIGIRTLLKVQESTAISVGNTPCLTLLHLSLFFLYVSLRFLRSTMVHCSSQVAIPASLRSIPVVKSYETICVYKRASDISHGTQPLVFHINRVP